MTKTYQAEYFTGAQLDGLMKKMLSGEIAGRGLEIDSNGNLNCSVLGYSKLIYSYTHTGNLVIQPTEVDISTGIFTAPAHGVTALKIVRVAMNPPYHIGAPYNYLPGGLTLGDTGVTALATMYYLRVVDEDHVAVSSTPTGDYLTYTESTEMDVQKFHFESITATDLTVEGIDLQDCLLVVKGKINSFYKWVRPTNMVSFDDNTGAIAYDEDFGIDQTGACYFGRPGYNFTYAVMEFKMLGECQAYQVNNVDYVVYSSDGTPHFRHNRQYFHMQMTSNKIEGLAMIANKSGGFFNGTTVEVYAK